MLDTEVKIIENKKNFRRFMDYVNKIKPEYSVLDVETDSLNEKVAKIFGLGICFNDKYSFYIPLKNPDKSEYWQFEDKEFIKWYIIALAKECKLIFHNAIYDLLVIENDWKVDLSPYLYSDTILLKHTTNENGPFGLKELGVIELGEGANLAQQELYDNIKKNGGKTTKEQMDMWKADTACLGKYCAHDVAITWRLFNIFQDRLTKEGLHDLFYKDEVMPLYNVTINMRREGFPIDLPFFQQLKIDIDIDINKLEEEIIKEIEPYVETFTKQLLEEQCPISRKGNFPKALAQHLGAPLPVTDEGKISISKKLVEKQLKLNPEYDYFYEWLLNIPKVSDKITDKMLEEVRLKKFLEDNERKYPFNLRSNDHLSYLLDDCLGLEIKEKTPKGKNKINEELFETLVSDNPIIQKLIEYKKLNKLYGTYIVGILDRQYDGKIYTSMLQWGTTSARYASKDPNLNNLPANSGEKTLVAKYTNAIRKGLIAGPGYKIIGSDFSSLEPHLAAYVSQDKELMDIFVSGKDFYSAIGIKQFNINDATPFKDGSKDSFSKKYPELRDLVKTYSLAAFYGATAPRISQVTGKTIKESERLLEGYFKAYPKVKIFISTTHFKAKKYGQVKTVLGRVRHLEKVKELYDLHGDQLADWRWAKSRGLGLERSIYRNGLNNAVNFQIQGLAAHCLNRAMIKIYNEFKRLKLDAQILLSIHDECLVRCKEEIVDQVAQIVKESMENCIDISPIKLKAQPIIGNNYGECK